MKDIHCSAQNAALNVDLFQNIFCLDHIQKQSFVLIVTVLRGEERRSEGRGVEERKNEGEGESERRTKEGEARGRQLFILLKGLNLFKVCLSTYSSLPYLFSLTYSLYLFLIQSFSLFFYLIKFIENRL